MSKLKALAKAGPGIDPEPKGINKEQDDMMDKHETNRHLDTISDAMDIMNDPIKMKKIHSMVGRKKKAITSLQQLRDIANKKAMDKDED